MQNELPLPIKKITKKNLLIVFIAFVALLVLAAAFAAIPSDIEAKALEALENKQEWQELESQAVYLQTQLQTVRDSQTQLHLENVRLETEITTEITGLDQVQ